MGGADVQNVTEKLAKQDLQTTKLDSRTESDAQSSKSSLSSLASEKESGNQGSSTTGTSSTTNGNGKKHPSPNMSDKKPGRSESSKAAAALQLPPPKTEEDKENLNIVFIGHVGERVCVGGGGGGRRVEG